MHIPDGFINGPTSAGAALLATGGLGASLRATGRQFSDRQIPVAGLAAAFIFVLQMLNFPVGAGTTGHLLGGALAVVLLGPAMGIAVVSVVVVVQALLFADGGISALGLNVLNMAILTTIAAWGVVWLASSLGRSRGAILIGTMLAGWCSVVVSSVGFSIEYLLGGRGGVDPLAVLTAMVGVHALIGIGEGLISATVVGAVLAVRPDLVWGASRLDMTGSGETARPTKWSTGAFVAGGVAFAVALVVFVAPNAATGPDGLQRVADDGGFLGTAVQHPIGGPFVAYQFQGLDGAAATVLSGLVGLVMVVALILLFAGIIRRIRARGAHP